MAGAAGNATAVVIVLAVTAALLASSLAPPADAFRTYFPEDEELLRNKGRGGATVVVMSTTAMPGSPAPVSPAGAPSGVELIAFAGHDVDVVSPGPAPSAGVDSELAAADDVILP
uniref:Dirigent protein n=1 Tax=Oryza punctata TaxID=4537 RepID=A0A0E0LEK3_ORYPU